jgi:hypothetical protein
MVEVGGWSIPSTNVFLDANKTISIDLSIVGAGALNRTARSHDLFNILSWYSGGGVTLYGSPPLTLPLPDFKIAYLPLVTLGFCFKELLNPGDNFQLLVNRLEECWKIIDWLNNIYLHSDVHSHSEQVPIDKLSYSKPLDLLLEQSIHMYDRVVKISEEIKRIGIETLDIYTGDEG